MIEDDFKALCNFLNVDYEKRDVAEDLPNEFYVEDFYIVFENVNNEYFSSL